MFTPYEKCLNDCSLLFGEYTWVIMIVLLILLAIITKSIASALDSAGRQHGAGVMNLLMLLALPAMWLPFLFLVWISVSVSGVDQYRCSKECAHLPNIVVTPE